MCFPKKKKKSFDKPLFFGTLYSIKKQVMPKLLFLLFLLAMNPFRIQAQIFQYITMEDGLSSRRVFSIRQDEQGYTWILTHKGIDRYDGKRFISTLS